MADYLINSMSEAIANTDNNRIANKNYYWFLTWGGLEKTNVWKYHWPNYPTWPPSNPSPGEDSTRGLKLALTLSRLDSIWTALDNELHGKPGALQLVL